MIDSTGTSTMHALTLFGAFLGAFFGTLFCYFLARFIYDKSGRKLLLQPMLLASGILLLAVSLSPISLEQYQGGTQLLTWLIAPLTIGLMVPLYTHLASIRKLLAVIFLTLLVCGSFTVIVTVAIAYVLGASEVSLLSLSSKSVTTPVALVIADVLHGIPSLAALIVMITGIIGILLAPIIFRILNIKDEAAQGITLGLSAHIIGTAYAMEKSSRIAAFSVIAMTLTALLTAISLPLLFFLFFALK